MKALVRIAVEKGDRQVLWTYDSARVPQVGEVIELISVADDDLGSDSRRVIAIRTELLWDGFSATETIVLETEPADFPAPGTHGLPDSD